MTTSRQRSHAGLNRFLWNALWRLYPPVALAVGASPDECLHTLAQASRPSTSRLHLRDLFLEGRRYYIQPRPDGFRLTSDQSPLWGRRRQRTRVAAYIVGTFSALQSGGDVTLVRLRARMYVLYTLSALLIPTFFASILVYMPWNRIVLVVMIPALYLLSWLGHRMNAAMQVNEMIWFVQKAFEDLPPVVVPELPNRRPDLVVESDFMAEWARFYKEHTES